MPTGVLLHPLAALFCFIFFIFSRAVFGAAQQLTERLEEAIAKQTVMFGYLSGFSTLLGDKGFFMSYSLVYQIQNYKSAPVSIF